MSAEYTELVTDMPIESLNVALEFVKGEPVNKHEAALAVVNVVSFAASQFAPGDSLKPVMLAAVPSHEKPTQEQAETAFKSVMSSGGKMKAGANTKLDWMTILKTLLALLPSLFA